MKTIRTGAAEAAEKTPTRENRRYWGSVELPKAKTDFFNAVTAAAGETEGDPTVATIRMYGPIDSWGGWWGISTEDVGRVLDALPESVEQIVLRINSPGGEVWEAMAILNMLGAHRARVTAVVDGLAASAASFIAASCDETVMSPGSQMMVHSPSSIAWGNATEMRKTAAFLDTLQDSMIEVYTAKAGEQDWATLLAEETWLTAANTVALGLADRVDVVPDAGTASTVGEDEPELLLVTVEPETDDAADAAARTARVIAAAASARAAAPKPPSSSEPGEPNQKENVVGYDNLKAGLREKLGVTDAAASDETLLAALDETLVEQAETPVAVAPAGTTLIDAGVLAGLQADAAAGREARAQQEKERRDGIVAKALAEGRITPASQVTWRAQLDTSEEGTATLLNSLPKNAAVSVTELGISDDVITDEDRAYASIFPESKKEA